MLSGQDYQNDGLLPAAHIIQSNARPNLALCYGRVFYLIIDVVVFNKFTSTSFLELCRKLRKTLSLVIKLAINKQRLYLLIEISYEYSIRR